ncbi:MAG: hypothetical protein ACKVW3_12615 [Phycisphaerales bacterium]
MNDHHPKPTEPQSSNGERRETKWTELRQRVESVVGLWIVIGAWFFAIGMGVWGVIYFFWYT